MNTFRCVLVVLRLKQIKCTIIIMWLWRINWAKAKKRKKQQNINQNDLLVTSFLRVFASALRWLITHSDAMQTSLITRMRRSESDFRCPTLLNQPACRELFEKVDQSSSSFKHELFSWFRKLRAGNRDEGRKSSRCEGFVQFFILQQISHRNQASEDGWKKTHNGKKQSWYS